MDWKPRMMRLYTVSAVLVVFLLTELYEGNPLADATDGGTTENHHFKFHHLDLEKRKSLLINHKLAKHFTVYFSIKIFNLQKWKTHPSMEGMKTENVTYTFLFRHRALS